MNKKAAFDMIVNIFRLLFVIVVFYSILFLARAFIAQKVDIFDVESKLLAHRLMFSNEVSYTDKDIGRNYIGVIDLKKFNSDEIEESMLNSIYYGKINSEASAKLTLKDLDDNIEYETFYNRELYDEKKVLVEAKLIGKGSAQSLDTNFYVLIKDDDKLKRGALKIEAILPNS